MNDSERTERARNLGTLALRSEREGDVHVIALMGELDLDGAPRFDAELAAAEASDAASIVVDLSGLDFIDSTGLRLIVMAAERSQPAGRFQILRGPAQVHRVFELTDLVDRLPFADA